MYTTNHQNFCHVQTASLIVLTFDDDDLVNHLQSLAGRRTDIAQADATRSVAVEQDGITAIVNQAGSLGHTVLIAYNNQYVALAVLENLVFFYAKSQGCSVSVGRIGKLECDFILRNPEQDYSYVQVAYTIAVSRETEDREYRPLEQIRDNYPKYLMTTDFLLQKRNGILHVNLMEFMKNKKTF